MRRVVWWAAPAAVVVLAGLAWGQRATPSPSPQPHRLTEAERQIELSCTPRIGASAPDAKVCGAGLASIRP